MQLPVREVCAWEVIAYETTAINNLPLFRPRGLFSCHPIHFLKERSPNLFNPRVHISQVITFSECSCARRGGTGAEANGKGEQGRRVFVSL
jgi:hypothetical protein